MKEIFVLRVSNYKTPDIMEIVGPEVYATKELAEKEAELLRQHNYFARVEVDKLPIRF